MQTFQRKRMWRNFDLNAIKNFILNKEQKIRNVQENKQSFLS